MYVYIYFFGALNNSQIINVCTTVPLQHFFTIDLGITWKTRYVLCFN